MSLSSGTIKARASLAFLGGAAYVCLGLIATLRLGIFIVSLVKAFQFGTLFFMLVTLVLMILCSRGYHACFRARRFLHEFGAWLDQTEPEEGPVERRAMLAGAREAFLAADYGKSAERMAKYLQARPSENISRLNYSRALAMAGRLEEAKDQIAISGDPYGQEAWLGADRSRLKWIRWRRPFEAAEVPALAHGWGLYALSGLGLLLGLSAVGLLSGQLNRGADYVSLLLTEKDPMQAAARMMGNYGGDAFRSEESANFVIYYHDENFMRHTLAAAEDALDFDLKFYDLPATQFNAKKIKIYLCSSQKEFLSRSPLNKPWEGGVTLDDYQEIYLYRFGPGQGWYFENTLAHEISHVCYRNILPTIGQDSWLNEGLAQYLGYQFSLARLNFPVSDWLKKNIFKDVTLHAISFDEFSHGNPQAYNDDARISQFYNQGFSMVFVLITYYDKDKFLAFLRDYSHSKDIDRSLNATYPTLHSMRDLQGAWSLFMK